MIWIRSALNIHNHWKQVIQQPMIMPEMVQCWNSLHDLKSIKLVFVGYVYEIDNVHKPLLITKSKYVPCIFFFPEKRHAMHLSIDIQMRYALTSNGVKTKDNIYIQQLL